MYIATDPKIYFDRYFNLIREIQNAAPSTALFFMKINDMILNGHYYKAMKESRELVKHEDELIGNVLKKQQSE